jgi:DEAD_2/PDZ domain
MFTLLNYSKINPRDGTDVTQQGDINNACRLRVSNTEKERKRQSKADGLINEDTPFGPIFQLYDDDNPPIHGRGDGDGRHTNEDEDSNKTIRLTCPHYRQLTSERTASMAQAKFAPTSCCSSGGEKTKMGVADIEDLVAFGLNPYVDKGVAIYRPPASKSWGIKLAKRQNGAGCFVQEMTGPAADEGTIQPKDYILAMNGKDMQQASLDVMTEVAKRAKSPLELDVMRDAAIGDDTMDDNDIYSSHSVCPYYLSRALAKKAELVLAPYNYILDPGIRSAMGIDLKGAVVVLDEGHNIEGTLREAGSGKFSELELCEIINLLERMSRRYNDKENDDGPSVEDIAHEFLLYVEALVHFLRDARFRFENNPGKSTCIRIWGCSCRRCSLTCKLAHCGHS